jgi:DNA repair protein RecO (recombination protein O)
LSAAKTQAFVLKTQDYRDTSLLAYFYTKDFGKIHGIVKGIRDSRGRFGSSLEPFSLNEIVVYRRKRGGDLHQVTQVDLLNLFSGVREDLERISYASYFVELVNEMVELEEPNTGLFSLLKDSLCFLESGASPKRAARIFELKLLEELGFMPEIQHCVVCQAENPEEAYFAVSYGGIHCASCKNAESAGFPVSKGTLQFLDHVRREPVKALYPVKVSSGVGEELEKILRRFVDFHLPHKLKSVAFLEKVNL